MRFPGRDGIEDGRALNGITNLVKVVGVYALLGFSGVVLEKEGKEELSAWDCMADPEAIESNTRTQKGLACEFYLILKFFGVDSVFFHRSTVSTKCPNLIFVFIYVWRAVWGDEPSATRGVWGNYLLS